MFVWDDEISTRHCCCPLTIYLELPLGQLEIKVTIFVLNMRDLQAVSEKHCLQLKLIIVLFWNLHSDIHSTAVLPLCTTHSTRRVEVVFLVGFPLLFPSIHSRFKITTLQGGKHVCEGEWLTALTVRGCWVTSTVFQRAEMTYSMYSNSDEKPPGVERRLLYA